MLWVHCTKVRQKICVTRLGRGLNTCVCNDQYIPDLLFSTNDLVCLASCEPLGMLRMHGWTTLIGASLHEHLTSFTSFVTPSWMVCTHVWSTSEGTSLQAYAKRFYFFRDPLEKTTHVSGQACERTWDDFTASHWGNIDTCDFLDKFWSSPETILLCSHQESCPYLTAWQQTHVLHLATSLLFPQIQSHFQPLKA